MTHRLHSGTTIGVDQQLAGMPGCTNERISFVYGQGVQARSFRHGGMRIYSITSQKPSHQKEVAPSFHDDGGRDEHGGARDACVADAVADAAPIARGAQRARGSIPNTRNHEWRPQR